jgi:hypothetical protein
MTGGLYTGYPLLTRHTTQPGLALAAGALMFNVGWGVSVPVSLVGVV